MYQKVCRYFWEPLLSIQYQLNGSRSSIERVSMMGGPRGSFSTAAGRALSTLLLQLLLLEEEENVARRVCFLAGSSSGESSEADTTEEEEEEAVVNW
jgi:hypothetical protein